MNTIYNDLIKLNCHYSRVTPLHGKTGFWAAIALLSPLLAVEALPASLQQLYVANEGSNTISIIDPAKRTVLTEIPTGKHPHNVNVDPLGRYFYVTNYMEDALQVFDVKTNALIATVKVGHQPAHIVSDSNGKRLYVSNEGGTTLSTVLVPEFKADQLFEIKGQGPHGHVLSPDGRWLLTPNSHSGDVALVNLADRHVDLIKLPPDAKPVAMGITSDGKLAFVTDAGLNQVHKIDLTQKKVVASLSVGKRPIQVPVHPTRPVLYIPCMESDALYKVDIERWKVEKIIPVGKGAHGIAYSQNGREAYVTLTWEKPKGKVAVVDTEKDSVVATLPVGEAPNGIALLFGKNQGR